MAIASFHHDTSEPAGSPQKRRVVLVGNPNVGKSVIFGFLTDRYVVVSNYPGTTVEVSEGTTTLENQRVTVLDTPGTNSLTPMSEDESVTRDILLGESSDVVIQVGDMKNGRRALLLSLQLAELGVPYMLVLNMRDEARARGVHVDRKALTERLGVEVLESVATRRQGVGRLKRCLSLARPARFRVLYERAVEDAVVVIEPLLPESLPRRAVALMLLAGDETLEPQLAEWLDADTHQKLDEVVRQAADRLGRDPPRP